MKASSILHSIKHFISKKESKTSSSSDISTLIYATLAEIKEEATIALDAINDQIDIYQARIELSSVLNDLLNENSDLRLEYGQYIGSLFGIINSDTQLIDEIVIHLGEIIEGGFDDYPSESVAALVIVWEEQAVAKLGDLGLTLDQLSAIRQSLDNLPTLAPIVKKQAKTIH